MTKLNKKVFFTLFFSLFAAVTGVGIVVPLLPVYAHDLGASGFYIASIFGAFSLSRTVFLPYFGRLSDNKGRKVLIVTGLFAYAIISVAFICAKDVETLIGIRLLQGIASAMIMPVTQAYVGDITPAGREGFVMGIFNMSVFLGLSIGPLIGGIIKDKFSINTSFICMGFLAAAGFIASLFLLPSSKSGKIICRTRKPKAWKEIIKDRNVCGLFLFRFAFATCIGIVWGFLPVLADMQFSLNSSSIGILVMLGVAVSGILHIPMGYIADRMNKKILVVLGGLITGGAFLLFAWAGGFCDLFFANLFFGIGGGISIPALMAMIVIRGDKSEAMGSIMGLITMAHSLGMLVGAFLAGLMMDMSQLGLAFLTGAVIMTLGVVFFSVCTYRSRSV